MEEKSLVWYACYGSNLLKDRFMGYIKGGGMKNNKGCCDKTPPIEDKPITIKHELYFSNSSKNWENGGVAFLKLEAEPEVITLGRAYLITEEQFKEVQEQEGLSPSWYGHILELGEMDGWIIKSFTAEVENMEYKYNMPSKDYIEVIKRGLAETYPEKSVEELEIYLNSKINI
jgi:hypothetical protein